MKLAAIMMLSTVTVGVVHANSNQVSLGAKAIRSMAGCYLVDYNYVETESLQTSYTRDSRIYDVNKTKSIKEWVFSEDISPTRIRLQHILFGTDLAGTLIEHSILKHQGEDWEYEAPFLYDFVTPLNWVVRGLEDTPEQWTRRITNLDDGLRYQCAAAWSEKTVYPEWSCDNSAPIPGRETRDMGRRDYNTLERSSRIIVYGGSWLERQANTKVNNKNGEKTPLAKELGKNWYVRLPDFECKAAQEFADSRRVFWAVLREVWDEVLIGDSSFKESPAVNQMSRYLKISEIEDRYILKDLENPEIRRSAASEIRSVIEAFRER